MTRWVGVIVEGAPGGARGNLSWVSPVLGSSASSGEKAVSCWVPCWVPCELGDLAIALGTMLILRWSFLAASATLSLPVSQLHCPPWWWPLVTCKIAFCHLNLVFEAISAPAYVLILLTETSWQAAPSWE